MKTYKVLALLLRYPEQDWLAELDELAAALQEERRSNHKAAERLQPLFEHLRRPLIETQGHYVDTFDRQPAHGLYLYEHQFGESRARGTAMVQMLEHYKEQGFELDCDELPDYLPVFLEFLSLAPRREVRRRLRSAAPALRILSTRLTETETPYAFIFDVLNRLTPRMTASEAPQAPRPMEQLMERTGRDQQGAEPLLTPDSIVNQSGNPSA